MSSTKFREEFEKYDPIEVEGVMAEHKKWVEERMRRHRSTIWINLASLCLSLLLTLGAFVPLRNLLTTLYPGRGLGYMALCCIYGSYVVGCLVLSILAHYIHPKGAVVISIIGHAVFAAAHFYPAFETLLPASCALGLCQALLWRAQELLSTSYAANYAALTGASVSGVLKRFHAALVLSVQLAQVIGNLLVSAVFYHRPDVRSDPRIVLGRNASTVGVLDDGGRHNHMAASYLPSKPHASSSHPDALLYTSGIARVEYCPVDPETAVDELGGEIHSLKITFLSFTAAALALVSVFLHKPDILLQKRDASLKAKFQELLRTWSRKRWCSIAGVMVYSGFQQALIIGELTKITGLCSLGVTYVGFLMMTFGMCSFISDSLSSRIQKIGGRILTGIAGFMLSGSLLSLTLLWRPDEAPTSFVFAYMGGWGMADGLWQSQITALVKATYAEHGEAVKVNAHALQALGSTIAFAYAPFVSFSTKAYVSLAIVAWAVMGYVVWESMMVPFQSRSLTSSV